MATLTLKQCLEQMEITPEYFVAMIESDYKRRVAEYALKHDMSVDVAERMLALENSCQPMQPAEGETP